MVIWLGKMALFSAYADFKASESLLVCHSLDAFLRSDQHRTDNITRTHEDIDLSLSFPLSNQDFNNETRARYLANWNHTPASRLRSILCQM